MFATVRKSPERVTNASRRPVGRETINVPSGPDIVMSRDQRQQDGGSQPVDEYWDVRDMVYDLADANGNNRNIYDGALYPGIYTEAR